MTKRFSDTKYPGENYHYVICDVCGIKLRAKDAVLIKDKFNLLHNMLVCKSDVDKTNPQTYIKAFKEKQIDNPALIRSEATDTYIFIDTVAQIEDGDTSNPSGRTANAPRFLSTLSVSDTVIELVWHGPDNPGSSAMSGYKIERESPVGGGFSTVTANSNSPATYYKDTGLTASTQYNYRVSAVNRDGTGTASGTKSATTAAS